VASAWSKPIPTADLGTVTDVQPNSTRHIIVDVTFYDVCPRATLISLTIVASMRAVKHWVSRWRRALQKLRRRNASMDLVQKLPSAPEIVHHVQSFL